MGTAPSKPRIAGTCHFCSGPVLQRTHVSTAAVEQVIEYSGSVFRGNNLETFICVWNCFRSGWQLEKMMEKGWVSVWLLKAVKISIIIYLMFLFIWNDKLFEYFDLLGANCYFQSTLKIINIRWMKGMVPSRDFSISASRQCCGSSAKVHGLSDLLCPECSLSFSLQTVSLQTMHYSFRKASLSGRLYTFWFILIPQVVHRSASALSCSEAGMGFLLPGKM